MTGVEAWRLMLTEGAKIRAKGWHKDLYIHLRDGIVQSHMSIYVENIGGAAINSDGWELYTEHTVTLAEAIACVMAGGTVSSGAPQLLHLVAYGPYINCHTGTRAMGFRYPPTVEPSLSEACHDHLPDAHTRLHWPYRMVGASDAEASGLVARR